MADYKSLSTTTTTGLFQHLIGNPPQRSNRFSVKFSGKNLPTTPESEFFATMVQLPSRGIMFFPDSVGPWSPVWKSPLKSTFDDKFLVEFIVDENFIIRKFIEKWMDTLTKDVNGPTIGGDTVKDCKMYINPITTNNTITTTIVLDYVYPKLILPSELNVDRPDLLRMQVDFNYRTATIL